MKKKLMYVAIIAMLAFVSSTYAQIGIDTNMITIMNTMIRDRIDTTEHCVDSIIAQLDAPIKELIAENKKKVHYCDSLLEADTNTTLSKESVFSINNSIELTMFYTCELLKVCPVTDSLYVEGIKEHLQINRNNTMRVAELWRTDSDESFSRDGVQSLIQNLRISNLDIIWLLISFELHYVDIMIQRIEKITNKTENKNE